MDIRLYGLSTLLALSITVISCGTSSRGSITCPAFSDYNQPKISIKHLGNKRGFPVHGRITGKKQHTGSSRKIQGRNNPRR
jgi:hypothetical protein